MRRIEETKRTIYDDFIVKVGSLDEARIVVQKFKELGYPFHADVKKYNCYYIAQRIVMDDGEVDGQGRSEFKSVAWGRSEVEEWSNEFNRMMTFDGFMGYISGGVVVETKVPNLIPWTLKRGADPLKTDCRQILPIDEGYRSIFEQFKALFTNMPDELAELKAAECMKIVEGYVNFPKN